MSYLYITLVPQRSPGLTVSAQPAKRTLATDLLPQCVAVSPAGSCLEPQARVTGSLRLGNCVLHVGPLERRGFPRVG